VSTSETASIEGLIAKGRERLRQSDREGAVQAFEHVLELEPDRLDALVPLSAALYLLGRYEAAEARCRQVLAQQPDHYAAVRNLAVILHHHGRYAEALEMADAVLANSPRHPQAVFARGNALYSLFRLEEAAAAFEIAAELDETRYEALTKLGLIYAALLRFEPALAALDRAIALRPDLPLGYYRRSIIRLLLRDFPGGWSDYEHRWKSGVFLHGASGAVTAELVPRLATPKGPEDLAGRRVLIVAEQGIGDEVMFASIVPDVVRTAAVTLVCEPRLVRLFSASFPEVTVLPAGAVLANAFDLILAMGSLGRLYRNRLEDFPGTPYLRPREAVRQRWAERLGPRDGALRVGISWRGGTPGTRGHSRSVTLDQLRPLLDLAGCEFVNLQYGDVAGEIDSFNRGRESPIRLFPRADIDDFEELAGLVGELDLVVSVQTALVHLCGAIGQTCLTLIPPNPEWRYAADGASIPWYRSVRLFRQAQVGDWGPVIGQITDEVRRRLG
jgi:tetratricopeptide (TPR) repeat protein